MHHAPSVSYPVGRCAFQRWLWWGHSLLSLTLWLTWGWSQPRGLLWACAGGVMAALACVGWRALQPDIRTVQWDGAHWRLEGADARAQPERVGQVKAVLDLQSTLLLQWQPISSTLGDSGHWVWLTRASCPELWLDVRRAVYSPHR